MKLNNQSEYEQLVKLIVDSSDCRFFGLLPCDEEIEPNAFLFLNSNVRTCVAMFDLSDVRNALDFASASEAKYTYIFGTNEEPEPVDLDELPLSAKGAPKGYKPKFRYFRNVHYLGKHETLLKLEKNNE